MKFDFERVIDRSNSYSIKHDFKEEHQMPTDAIPMWVADMDFESPPAVRDAILRQVERGVFGYAERKPAYFAALHNWAKTRWGWEPEADWLVLTAGVVHAIATAIRAYTKEGEAVMIQQPLYAPFLQKIQANHRKPVNNGLVLENGQYRMDFALMERQMVEEKVKLFLLCSPHNPTGRVWSETDLKRVAELCKKHGVLLLSDEIHADFIYPGHKQHSIFSLEESYRDFVICCTAPSKTFNVAGLHTSNIFIPNSVLREKFVAELDGSGGGAVSVLGLLACQAAYEQGGDWLDELLVYLKGNVDFVRDFLKENLPQVKMTEPDGTYLLWLDFRALGLTLEEQGQLLNHTAKVWTSAGVGYGEDGAGFERLNIGCSRAVLKQAMEQIAAACATLQK